MVVKVERGDEEALQELRRRYAGLLLGLARRVLGSREEAEEVVQEVLVQLWQQAGRYDARRSSVSTWLVMLTRSRAIDRLRCRRVGLRAVERMTETDPRALHASARGPETVLWKERRQRLQAELAELPEEQREVLELAYYRGLTQREIATETGTPLGTVKTRTLLALRKLAAGLRDEIEELL